MRTIVLVAAACLVAAAALPAEAECPGRTDLERARCTQIRKEPTARANPDTEAQRRAREAWRDGYRTGRREAQRDRYETYDRYGRPIRSRGVVVIPSEPE